MSFTISSDATITYQPGYLDYGYSFPSGVYNVDGKLIIPGPVTIYTKEKTHTGYLTFATSRGDMMLDGDKGKREIIFSAGKSPSVTPTTETKIFLVNTGSTATQNFAFDMDEEDI